MPITTPAADWLVLASICECDHVTASVLETYDHDNTDPDADEVIRIGPDWRTLLVDAVSTLHASHPDLTVSAQCTAAYARDGYRDRARQEVLTAEVTEWMHAAFGTEHGPAHARVILS